MAHVDLSDSSLTLQVPHMPCVHEDGSRRPAARAASSTVWSAAQPRLRWLRSNRTV